jgi:serine phosphatase RsbU (regulator of sigma subunit)
MAIEYRGKTLIDAFRKEQVAFREETTASARAADARLEQSIDETLAVGVIATVLFLFAGWAATVYQTRTAQRLAEISSLYENERRIADALQEAFLQRRLPSSEAIALHATYVPASNEARVGGDWYDAFELPDGRILFSIGDVAGHGIEAAVVMSRARQAIIAAALHETDPAAVLGRANATIVLQGGPMITAICGFIDPQNLELVYSTAGHPAPAFAPANASAKLLPQDGIPLGLFPDVPFRTFVAQAAPGDLLVFYTDGVTEHKRDVVVGEARLLAAASLARPAENPAASVYGTIFGSDLPADDVAILTVSFKGGAQRRAAGEVLEDALRTPTPPPGP